MVSLVSWKIPYPKWMICLGVPLFPPNDQCVDLEPPVDAEAHHLPVPGQVHLLRVPLEVKELAFETLRS